MHSEKVVFIGYHGTKFKNIDNIVNTGFNPSLKGWLGKGVYFFQEDKELANNWGKRRYLNQKVGVIKREIHVDKDIIFDITNPLSIQNKDFQKNRESFIAVMERKGYIINENTKESFEGKVIDAICIKKKYSVVRAFTYTYQDYDKRYKLQSKFANGIELCVKNTCCIIE
jgi:hypothetical protein